MYNFCENYFGMQLIGILAITLWIQHEIFHSGIQQNILEEVLGSIVLDRLKPLGYPNFYPSSASPCHLMECSIEVHLMPLKL